eukprot:GFKZ01006271.1.p1 GENE.GFKZ01006271.1~~GFKZ01006271.1.p1  ORF type:complete len:435 (-),score=33.23 GFKZ01006271.1:17-1321(-)
MRVTASVDRQSLAPGAQPRVLLKSAAASLSPYSPSATSSSRRDSTECSAYSGTTSSSSLQRLDPRSWFRSSHSLPSDFAQLWNFAVEALSNENLRDALRAMRKLSRQDEPPYSLRASAVLCIYALSSEWGLKANLSTSAARKLWRAITHGSSDAIALGLYLYYERRWTPPSTLSIEAIVDTLEDGAVAGHVPSQAVFGALLCRARPFHVERSNGKRERHLPREAEEHIGTSWLRTAGSRGFFIALDLLELSMLKSMPGQATNRVPETFGLSLAAVSEQEYFSYVQQGANDLIPDCCVRLAKLLRKGIGCNVNEAESKRWIAKAAKFNAPGALSMAQADILRSNMELSELLSKKVDDEEFRLMQNEARQKAQINHEESKEYEVRMNHWRSNNRELKQILTLHRLGNLQSAFSKTICEGLLRFIFERDRDGWNLDE